MGQAPETSSRCACGSLCLPRRAQSPCLTFRASSWWSNWWVRMRRLRHAQVCKSFLCPLVLPSLCALLLLHCERVTLLSRGGVLFHHAFSLLPEDSLRIWWHSHGGIAHAHPMTGPVSSSTSSSSSSSNNNNNNNNNNNVTTSATAADVDADMALALQLQQQFDRERFELEAKQAATKRPVDKKVVLDTVSTRNDPSAPSHVVAVGYSLPRAQTHRRL